MKFSTLPLEKRCEEATMNLVLRFQLEVSPWSELYIMQEHLLVKNHLVRPEGNVLTLIITGSLIIRIRRQRKLGIKLG